MTGSAPTSPCSHARKLMPVKPKATSPKPVVVPISALAKALDLTPLSNEMDGSTYWSGQNPISPNTEDGATFVLNPDGTAFDLVSKQEYSRLDVAGVAAQRGRNNANVLITCAGSTPEPPETKPSDLLWLASPEVSLLLWVLLKGALPPAALSLKPDCIGPRGAPARLVYDTIVDLFSDSQHINEGVVVGTLYEKAEMETNTDVHLLICDTAAFIKRGGLDSYAEKRDKKLTPWELGEKLARKLQPPEPKREKRNEPTPVEILDTADALHQLGEYEDTFAEYRADGIPAPALHIGEKPEYSAHQIRVLLYPKWMVESLETEFAHAARAVQTMGVNLLYCPQLGFIHWDKSAGHWRQDDKDSSILTSRLAKIAPQLRGEVAALLRYAATLTVAARDSDARAMTRAAGSLLNHVKNIERQSFLTGVAKFLAAEVRTEVENFTPQAWRFAFKNATFDRGAWRYHKREDYHLNVSPVVHDRNTDPRDWEALKRRMWGQDEELIRTAQHIAAYAVSGASTLRILPWCFGKKGTGKSTFGVMLHTLLGKSAMTLDPLYLSDKASREALGARIFAKRAALVMEAGNQQVSAEAMKTLSGGDPLSVCFKYKEAFDTSPTHALILIANDPPKMDINDEALRDRLLALPFNNLLLNGPRLNFTGHKRVEDARKDPDSLLVRGFAVWVAEGLADLWKEQEIYRAPAVVAATQAFLDKTDPLAPFWDTIRREALEKGMPKADLRLYYENWCVQEKQRTLNRQKWPEACKAHGLRDERSNDKERTPIWIF